MFWQAGRPSTARPVANERSVGRGTVGSRRRICQLGDLRFLCHRGAAKGRDLGFERGQLLLQLVDGRARAQSQVLLGQAKNVQSSPANVSVQCCTICSSVARCMLSATKSDVVRHNGGAMPRGTCTAIADCRGRRIAGRRYTHHRACQRIRSRTPAARPRGRRQPCRGKPIPRMEQIQRRGRCAVPMVRGRGKILGQVDGKAVQSRLGRRLAKQHRHDRVINVDRGHLQLTQQ